MDPVTPYEFVDDPDTKISRRDEVPAHYVLRIESFSQLPDLLTRTTTAEIYESGDFESGGYKWKLLLYPNGDLKMGGEGHISLYLVMAEKPPAFGVNVKLKLFVFDQIRDQYLTFKDRRIRRYNAWKVQYGFVKLIPLKAFTDSSNGYLVDDCCAFGAEVHVMNYQGKGEKLSVLRQPREETYTWNIETFGNLECKEFFFWVEQGKDLLESQVFTVGGHKWKLWLYPKGWSSAIGKFVSLFLCTVDFNDNPRDKVCAEFKLSIKDQLEGKHFERTASHNFCHSSTAWGYSDFMSLSDLHEKSKGFIVNDTLIAEVEITVVSTVESLS